MMDRYHLPFGLDELTADAEATTAEERHEFEVIFERLAFIDAGGPMVPDSGLQVGRM